MSEKIYNMAFKQVYPALLAKVERKGGRAEDVYRVTAWLTGYEAEEIEAALNGPLTYGDFFRQVPAYPAAREKIVGSICGVRIEEIEDPLMQEIRRLDKLVDWLAKGKSPEGIFAKYEK